MHLFLMSQHGLPERRLERRVFLGFLSLSGALLGFVMFIMLRVMAFGLISFVQSTFEYYATMIPTVIASLMVAWGVLQWPGLAYEAMVRMRWQIRRYRARRARFFFPL